MTRSSESEAPEGIFGGTFDPIHNGHIAVAEQCAQQLGLGAVLMIPAGQPPHRPSPVAPAQHRLAMVEAAVSGHPLLQARDLEVRRPGPSYTIDTIHALLQERPGRSLILLMGWDAALDFKEWHSADEIVSLVRIAVFNRSGRPSPDRGQLREMGLPDDAYLGAVDSPSISAAEIRRSLAGGEDVSSFLPPPVDEYIGRQGLYRG